MRSETDEQLSRTANVFGAASTEKGGWLAMLRGGIPTRTGTNPKGHRQKGRTEKKRMSPPPRDGRLRPSLVKRGRIFFSAVQFFFVSVPWVWSPAVRVVVLCVLYERIVGSLGGGWGDENFLQLKTFLVGGSRSCECGSRSGGLGLWFANVPRYRCPDYGGTTADAYVLQSLTPSRLWRDGGDSPFAVTTLLF